MKAVTINDIFALAFREGKKNVLRARLERYAGYIARDRELVEKTGKTKYKRRLRNHLDKFNHWAVSLENLENAGAVEDFA